MSMPQMSEWTACVRGKIARREEADGRAERLSETTASFTDLFGRLV